MKKLNDKSLLVTHEACTHNDGEQGLFSSIFDSLADPVIYTDKKGIIKYWNTAAETVFGYERNEVTGKNISLLHPSSKSFEAEIKQVIKTHIQLNGFIAERQRKDGSIVSVSLNVSPVIQNDEVAGITFQVRTCAETNSTDQSLRESAADYRSIIENAEEGFVLIDTTGRIKAFNSRAKDSIIFNNGQVAVTPGDNLLDFLPGERREFFRKVMETVLTGKTLRYDRSYEKDGKPIWLTFSVVPIKEGGAVTAISITGSDVTKRKLAEENADRSEKRFRAIVENSGDAVAILSKDAKPIYVSPSIKNILGYTEEEAGKMDFFPEVHPDDINDLMNIWEVVKTNPGKTLSTTSRAKHKDGNWRWIEATLTNMTHDPAVGGIVDNFRDVTEKRKAECAVESMQRKMDIAIRLMQIGYWEWNLSDDAVMGSDRFYEIFGLDKNDVFYVADFQAFTHPDDRDYLNNLIEEITPENSREPVELRFVRTDGAIRFIQTNREALFDENGHLIKYIGSIVDITDQRLAEKTVADNAKRFRKMVENSGDGVTIMNSESKPLYVSPSITMLLGYTEEEAMQLDLFSLVHPLDLPMVKYVWEEILSKPGIPHYDNICRIRHKNGTWRWFNGTITNMLHDPAIGGVVDNFRDVTEKREADKKLKSSEERYRYLFYNNPLPMWIYDPQTFDFIEVNNSAIQKYGYTREEFLQMTIHDIRPEFELKRLNHVLQAPDGETHDNQWIHLTKAQEELYVEVTRHNVFFEGKNAMLIVANDITEKKQAAQLLMKAYTEKTNILESITDGFYTVDKNWIITYLNKAAENMLKMRREDLLGRSLWSLFGKEELKNFESEYHRAMNEQVPVNFQEFFEPINMWIEVTAYPSDDGLSVYVKDVTERKIADEKIKTAKERYELVASVTNDAIYEWDLTNQLIFWGEGFSSLFGHPRTDDPMSMNTWIDNLHPAEKEQLMASTSAAIDNKATSLMREFRFRCADGNYKTVLDKLGILYDNNDNPVKIIGAMHDITEQKQNELAVATLNDQLKVRATELISSNEELERFAYVASHDLQEPLRMVSSFLQLLQKKYKDQLDQTANQYIDFAVDGAERMKRLILDLLEYSRVGTNKDVLAPTNVGDVVNQVLKNYDSKIIERDAVIRVQIMPTLSANKMQLTQLFQNLLGNALKYNTAFVPEIEIGCEEKTDCWQFFVKDNGIGIDPKFNEKVFIIFQRLHNKKQFSGTGIGLAICKKIVERHGGNIWIESELGNGSTFYFTIKK